MDDEPERRFEAIMNKLFQVPTKSKLNALNNRQEAHSIRGKKRLSSALTSETERNVLRQDVMNQMGSTISVSDTLARTSKCRPGDRDDFFRRLSTFRSMTWFAKPQVVSPVNCARRGWINVDVDTISCTACGTRLLFSTPTAWTLKQVEKAAAVFSLKLESGHKLLCPWINSVCSEDLAHFPAVSRAELIQDFKKRYFSLSQLVALPVISSVAIDNMKNPELEKILSEVTPLEYHKFVETSSLEQVGVIPDSAPPLSYQQTQMLISLCGWEPHNLPYTVDFKDGKFESVRDTNVISNAKRQKVGAPDVSCINEDTKFFAEAQSSALLICNLCGATVGLWGFCTVPRPLEYVRLMGSTEVGANDSAFNDVNANGSLDHVSHARGKESAGNSFAVASTSAGITIAGGPSPATLNYNAIISLPVIGKSLRARLLRDVESKLLNQDYDKSPEGMNVSGDDCFGISGPDLVEQNLSNNLLNVSERSCSTVNSLDSDSMRCGTDNCSSPGGLFPTREDNFTSNNNIASKVNEEDSVAPRSDEHITFPSNSPDVRVLEELTKKKQFSTKESLELPELPAFDRKMEFDPVKQHRHFCPWILTANKSIPGWEQTLSALHGYKEISLSSLNNAPASPVIEVDDPVASATNFFTSHGNQ